MCNKARKFIQAKSSTTKLLHIHIPWQKRGLPWETSIESSNQQNDRQGYSQPNHCHGFLLWLFLRTHLKNNWKPTNWMIKMLLLSKTEPAYLQDISILDYLLIVSNTRHTDMSKGSWHEPGYPSWITGHLGYMSQTVRQGLKNRSVYMISPTWAESDREECDWLKSKET